MNGHFDMDISPAITVRVEWAADVRVIPRVMRDDPRDDRDIGSVTIEAMTLIDETSDATINLDLGAMRALGLYDTALGRAYAEAEKQEIEE
jgi:hypothetical protein